MLQTELGFQMIEEVNNIVNEPIKKAFHRKMTIAHGYIVKYGSGECEMQRDIQHSRGIKNVDSRWISALMNDIVSVTIIILTVDCSVKSESNYHGDGKTDWLLESAKRNACWKLCEQNQFSFNYSA